MNDDIDRDPVGESGSVQAAPLPKEWLPKAAPPDGHTEWEARTARIMSAVGPEWARLRLGGRAMGPSWLAEMGRWLRPAAALAAAGAGLLLWVTKPPAPSATFLSAENVALGLVVSDGDPVALWAALGVQADPVLALLTFEDHRALRAPTGPSTPSEEAIR